MKSTKTLNVIIIALGIALAISVSFNFSIPTKPTADKFCLDYSNESIDLIEFGVINNMVKNYEGDQLANMRFGETQYIDFDIDSINKFIYHIKREVQQNSSNPSQEEIGLRIYLGTYPKLTGSYIHDDLRSLPSSYGNRMSVVFVPTRKNSSGNTVAFNPSMAGTYSQGINILGEGGVNGTSNPLGILLGANDPIPAFMPMKNQNEPGKNHGTLFP